MSAQLSLAFDRERTIDAAFAAFHEANPQVYAELKMLAVRARRRGAHRIGIGMLFEVLRWRHTLRTEGDTYKLNNNYRSRYARMLNHEPELAGCFETRGLRAA